MKIFIRAMPLLTVMMFPYSLHAAEVSKSDWISAMTTVLPTAFCNSSQYFRQCFNVTAQECEETAASAARVCLNKNKDQIPEVLHQPQDGTHWGTVVGACAGEAYELALVKKRISNSKCDDPANWQ
ncbi:MAG: hypothetical protein CVV05_03575 [Gammaproteobacteria bacterium HGW-Gammaproteobacteria-1]|jgi:hypothetical protein|nr:MAG: hypothetical protein CVV05_03575 [Gammaproteobacteria bacterium HGW-Gammaproteobacteria-1]